MKCHPFTHPPEQNPKQERIMHLFNTLRGLVDDDSKAEELVRIKINSHTEGAIAPEEDLSAWVLHNADDAEIAFAYAVMESLIDQHKSMRKTVARLYQEVNQLKQV